MRPDHARVAVAAVDGDRRLGHPLHHRSHGVMPSTDAALAARSASDSAASTALDARAPWQAAPMATQRQVTVERIATGTLRRRQPARWQVAFGTGTDGDFTPTELLLAAIGGCTAIDVDILRHGARRVGRRSRSTSAPRRSATTRATALTDIAVTFRVTFPPGETATAPRGAAPGGAAVTRPPVHRRPDRRAAAPPIAPASPSRPSGESSRRRARLDADEVEEVAELVVDVLETRRPSRAPARQRRSQSRRSTRSRSHGRRAATHQRRQTALAGDEHDHGAVAGRRWRPCTLQTGGRPRISDADTRYPRVTSPYR